MLGRPYRYRECVHSVFLRLTTSWRSSLRAPLSTASSEPRLVLHLDVNKTIVFADIAGGLTPEDVVSHIIADNAWGWVTDGPKWQLASSDLFEDTPTDLVPPEGVPAGSRLATYDDFVKKILYVKQVAARDATSAELDAVRDHNQAQKDEQRPMLNTFTASGNPGAAFRPVFEEMVSSLRVPSELQAACSAVTHIFDDGWRLLSPAYFRTLEALTAWGREFRIVLRTFGTDLPELVHEHNLFCTGKHPLYPGAKYDGTDGTMDLRVRAPDGTGMFHRHGHDSEHFLLATTTRTTAGDELVDITIGYSEVADALDAKFALGHRVLAMRDNYEWWYRNGMVEHAGKPLLVDTEDTTVHPIFFDDNIDDHRAKIVDVRSRKTHEPLPFDEANEVFMFQVTPVNALRNPDFFLEAINACEENRRERIRIAAEGGAGAGGGK